MAPSRFRTRTHSGGSRILATVASLLCGVATLSAQQSFDEWREEQDRRFGEFVSREDAAFAEYLEREWQEFEAFLERESFYAQPKLEAPPVADAASPRAMPEATPMAPPVTDRSDRAGAEEGSRAAMPVFTITFHGARIRGSIPEAALALRLESVDPAGFAAYWQAAAASGLSDLVEEISGAALRHALNSYSAFQATIDAAQEIYVRDRDVAAAVWYAMVKSGYDMRIAYSGERVALLLPSTHQLYGVSYIRSGDYRHYMLNADGSPVNERRSWRTYRSEFPGATRTVGLQLPPQTDLPDRTSLQQLTFRYDGREFRVSVPVNEHVVGLMRDYPFTDWWVHFTPTASRTAREALVSRMRSLVQGRSNADAANLLIRFVQTAFPYQTDQEHFGFEKWQAPEEILYYRLSDCDDRSVLYAFLLREVMGWDDVAVLHYPGHLAVAVPQARLGIEGDAVIHNGVRYIVTDPTYIGADIGRAMPQFRDVAPEVLLLSEVM